MYELLLPGQRVCINPDSPDYKFIKEEYGTVGTVVSIPGGIDSMKSFFYSNKKETFFYDVKFDNDVTRIERIMQKDLLSINQYVNVTKYILNNEDVIYQINNEPNANKVNDWLDRLVIKKQYKINHISEYDDRWRRQVTGILQQDQEVR